MIYFNTESINHNFPFPLIFESDRDCRRFGEYKHVRKTQRVAHTARNNINQIKLYLYHLISF